MEKKKINKIDKYSEVEAQFGIGSGSGAKSKLEVGSKTEQADIEAYYDERAEKILEEKMTSAFLVENSNRNTQDPLEAGLGTDKGREVLINIIGRHWGNNRELEEISVKTHGYYYEKNNKHYLVYTESDESGIGGSKVILSYNGAGDITVRRIGQIKSKIHLVEGRYEISKYKTPLGSLNLRFYTDLASFRGRKNGGAFKLRYNENTEGIIMNSAIDIKFNFLSN